MIDLYSAPCAGGDPEDGHLAAFTRLLSDGCRCFSLALTETTELQVVTQGKHVAFAARDLDAEFKVSRAKQNIEVI